MIRSLLIALLFLLFAGRGIAQKYVDENSTTLERLYFGGNFGLSLSNNFTQIEVSPIVGYMITENFSAGVGVIYQYLRADLRASNGQSYSIDTNIYGGKLFGRYNITNQLFAYSELEALSFEVYQNSTEGLAREIVPSLFIGAGYFMPIAQSAGISAVALYNVLYDPFTSPYNSPFVLRVGFTF